MRVMMALLMVVGLAGCVGTQTQPPAAQVMKGSVAPEFSLADVHGGTKSLAGMRSGGPVVLIFYQGYSCPHCVMHLRAMEDQKADFDHAQATIAAISADTVAESKDSIGLYGDFAFPLLSDPDHAVAKEYGMMFDAKTAYHGVVVINSDGVVKFIWRGSKPYEDIDQILWSAQRADGHKLK